MAERPKTAGEEELKIYCEELAEAAAFIKNRRNITVAKNRPQNWENERERERDAAKFTVI